ncbi:MAG: glycosyltransferase family 2 protein [Anaerohalosphaeraceae bacterium]|nr:glycosyltransferase family 2 protein [Anaerohalosphaeraceae bacterium]
MSETPFVSIIMPVRNEADFIEQTISGIMDNDYPANKMEIIVVDGRSDDGTQDIVRRMSKEDNCVRLLDNPAKIQAIAMNIGLRDSKGDIFIRIDGHAEVSRDFIRNSVDCLLSKSEAWVVGGAIETIGQGYVAQAIANCMKSPVGVGNSRFRLGDYEGWVDTLAFGSHHKWILERIGYFDEQLVRNEDDDFNMRIVLAGGKIWLSKSIRSIYYSRGSLRKLWKQYFQYGFWRIRTMQKHKRPATLRQTVPLLFVMSVLALGVLSLLWYVFWYLLVAELILYLAGIILGAIDVGRKTNWKYSLLSPVIFVILHFGYGIGCLWGFVRFILIRGKFMPKPEEVSMSR